LIKIIRLEKADEKDVIDGEVTKKETANSEEKKNA